MKRALTVVMLLMLFLVGIGGEGPGVGGLVVGVVAAAAAPVAAEPTGVSARGDGRAEAPVESVRWVVTLEVTESSFERAREKLASLELDLTHQLRPLMDRDGMSSGVVVLESAVGTKGGKSAGGVVARRTYTIESVPAEKFGDWVEWIFATELPITGTFEFSSTKGAAAVDTATQQAMEEAQGQAKSAAQAAGSELGSLRHAVVHRTIRSPSGTFARKSVRFNAATGAVSVEVKVEATWDLP